jgi:hypothetical protein
LLSQRLAARIRAWRQSAPLLAIGVGVSIAALVTATGWGRKPAIPLRLMLGRVRIAFLTLASLLHGGLAVTLLAATAGWFRWLYLGAVLIAYALTTFGIRQAGTRATLALDSSSLAIDERLRSEDAFHAAFPLYLLSFALFPGATAVDAHWMWQLSFGVGITVFLLFGLAGICRPWQPLRRSLRGPFETWAPSLPTDENPYAHP